MFNARFILIVQGLVFLTLFVVSTISLADQEHKEHQEHKDHKDKDKDKHKKDHKDKDKDKHKKDHKDNHKEPLPPPLGVIQKAPPPLTVVDVPEISGIDEFVRKKDKVILLGKTLFWDQAVGSDGQACASCHFHAGADNRVKNQLSPGLLRENNPDTTFQKTASGGNGGPNYTLLKNDFPFHQFSDPDNQYSGVIFSSNDVVSSQGSFGGNFQALPPISELNDVCDQFPDPVFHVDGTGVRKVEPRHTPTVINAVFNFRNFWDGRANNVFNAVDPFGLRNGDVLVFKKGQDSIKRVSLRNSSLASQAVGPPMNDFEMICSGRKFAQLGRKLIHRRGLATQDVHKDDSVLGEKRNKHGSGLKDTYKKLIENAFNEDYWGSDELYDGFTQMEANFSLFWGIALQMYQATLVSDKSPYDKFAKGMTADFDPDAVSDKQKEYLSAAQFRGLKLFLDKGKCINCHGGSEFTGAASGLQSASEEGGLVERMFMGDGGVALYDQGFYNIGVTPTDEDIGVGGDDAFGNPLSFTVQYVNQNFVDPIHVDPCTFEVLFDSSDCSVEPDDLMDERVAVRGAFKVPTLRNVELTGPYMHNGSMATLEQVVDFYNRGGNFSNPELDSDIQPLGLSGQEKSDLVAFMTSLTDKRVAEEKKPFDHPQLFVSNGHPGDGIWVQDSNDNSLADDSVLEIPAVGKKGRKKQKLPTLKPFHVNLN